MPRYHRVNAVRIPEQLAAKIKRAAERNQNTFNGEISSRLQQSFEADTAKTIEAAVADLTKTVRKLEAAE